MFKCILFARLCPISSNPPSLVGQLAILPNKSDFTAIQRLPGFAADKSSVGWFFYFLSHGINEKTTSAGFLIQFALGAAVDVNFDFFYVEPVGGKTRAGAVQCRLEVLYA